MYIRHLAQDVGQSCRVFLNGFADFGFEDFIKMIILGSVLSLHRQLLYVTSFIFAGYYLFKRQDYMYAVRDRDMFGYMNSHPEDFPEKDKKTYGEILEEFHPVR